VTVAELVEQLGRCDQGVEVLLWAGDGSRIGLDEVDSTDQDRVVLIGYLG
jgi:hypothetical protein